MVEGGVTFCWPPTQDTRQVWPRIGFAKSRETEYYGVNSKGGVSFQVTLKENRVKRDLPVPCNIVVYIKV
jgi:D-hexose-6-phosphate mutarotase